MVWASGTDSYRDSVDLYKYKINRHLAAASISSPTTKILPRLANEPTPTAFCFPHLRVRCYYCIAKICTLSLVIISALPELVAFYLCRCQGKYLNCCMAWCGTGARNIALRSQSTISSTRFGQILQFAVITWNCREVGLHIKIRRWNKCRYRLLHSVRRQ